MAAFNDTLLNVSQNRHLECVDLASMLEKDTIVFYDDAHFNESGSQKVAMILSEYLLKKQPFLPAMALGAEALE